MVRYSMDEKEGEMSRKRLEACIKAYGLGSIGEVTPASISSSECYFVATTTGKWVVKFIEPKFTNADVLQEVRLAGLLNDSGIQSSVFKRSLDGDYMSTIGQDRVTVQALIEGQTFEMNQGPPWLVDQAASTLGRIHRLFESEDLKERDLFQYKIPESFVAKRISQFEQIIKNAEASDWEERHQLMEDARWRIAQLSSLLERPFPYEKFSVGPSHGDFNILQLIARGSKFAVIDLTGACSLPLAWEVVRSYTYSSQACKNGHFDIKGYVAYWRLYLEQFRLPRFDILNAHRLIFAQILLSFFGFYGYLDGTMSNTSLKTFGFWRTNMCRSILEQGKDIDKALHEAFGTLKE